MPDYSDLCEQQLLVELMNLRSSIEKSKYLGHKMIDGRTEWSFVFAHQTLELIKLMGSLEQEVSEYLRVYS